MDKDEKIRWGFILIIGSGFFLSTVLIGLFNSPHQKTVEIIGLIISSAGGSAFAILAGFLLNRWFSRSKYIQDSLKIDLLPNEYVLFSSDANYIIKNIFGSGGRLYLTNQRLIFKSHKLNFKKYEIPIGLTDTANISQHRNRLSLIMNDDRKYNFVVYRPQEWKAQLNGEPEAYLHS